VLNIPDNEKQNVMKIVLERGRQGTSTTSRDQLVTAQSGNIQKTMEMELNIALSIAKEDPTHESWKEYRILQRELADCWSRIEQKHVENKKRDAYESEIVNYYLS
jgi:hypothetical protein